MAIWKGGVLVSATPVEASGRSMGTRWRWVMLRLTSMKRGEQEKHDVDERDDLDPRFIALVAGAGCGVGRASARGAVGGEGFEVVAVFPGGLDEQLGVVDPALQRAAEDGDALAEKVVGQQAEDGDGDAAGGGDERLGDAAGDLGGGELFVADKRRTNP